MKTEKTVYCHDCLRRSNVWPVLGRTGFARCNFCDRITNWVTEKRKNEILAERKEERGY